MKVILRMRRIPKDLKKMWHPYDKNLLQVRYKYLSKKFPLIYIGLKVLAKVGFEIGDSLILAKKSKNTFNIEKNVYGNPLRIISNNHNAHYAQFQIPPKVGESFELPKTPEILILTHKAHINKEDPDLNYIEVKF